MQKQEKQKATTMYIVIHPYLRLLVDVPGRIGYITVRCTVKIAECYTVI